MINLLKELYLTVFTLGFRLGKKGGWDRISMGLGLILNMGNGVLLISLIIIFSLSGIRQCIEIHEKNIIKIDPSWELCSVVAIYYVNFYILVTSGYGTRFEREFDNIEKRKKKLLLISGILLVVATMVFVSWVRSVHQRLFYGHP